jgi:hypothetical protein
VQQLIRQPPTECATAFAHVWTTQEARLKCAELELCEWTPELEEHMRGQEVYVLSLPAPYCGALAWAPTPISKK